MAAAEPPSVGLLLNRVAGNRRSLGADPTAAEIQAGRSGYDQIGRQNGTLPRGLPSADDHEAAQSRVRARGSGTTSVHSDILVAKRVSHLVLSFLVHAQTTKRLWFVSLPFVLAGESVVTEFHHHRQRPRRTAPQNGGKGRTSGPCSEEGETCGRRLLLQSTASMPSFLMRPSCHDSLDWLDEMGDRKDSSCLFGTHLLLNFSLFVFYGGFFSHAS